MSDERYRAHRSHITNANEARQKASELQIFYDEAKLKKENRYRVKGQAFPKTTNGFNWGACLLTPIWGFYNKTPIACLWILFALIPFVGIILSSIFSIFCGIKGNEWAWENNEWQNVEEMHFVQRKWAMAGVIVEIIAIFIFCGYVMHQINSIQRHGLM